MSDLVKISPSSPIIQPEQFIDPAAVRALYPRMTEGELKLFMYQCIRTGLDPLSRQIYATWRWNSREGRDAMTVIVGIDGLRLIAARSGEYAGQEGPFWAGPDGEWREVWVPDEPPVAAKVSVWRTGFTRPVVGIAHYREYAQRDKGGKITAFWDTKACVMLAKAAEALGLRKAFPQILSGLYIPEEMGEGKEEQAVAIPGPQLAEARARLAGVAKDAKALLDDLDADKAQALRALIERARVAYQATDVGSVEKATEELCAFIADNAVANADAATAREEAATDEIPQPQPD